MLLSSRTLCLSAQASSNYKQQDNSISEYNMKMNMFINLRNLGEDPHIKKILLLNFRKELNIDTQI